MNDQKIRLVGGGIFHETNTFVERFFAGKDNWMGDFPQFGDAAINHFRNKHVGLSAMIHVCEREGVTLIPTAYGIPDSNGRVINESYYALLTPILQGIEAALPVDGVLLGLHGGGATEDEDDLEGHVLQEVRKVVGDKIPIATCFDMHANISSKTMDNVDILTGYDTYPHVDEYDRTVEATQFLLATIRGEISPKIAFTQPNMIITPVMQKAAYYPMNKIIEKIHEIEAHPKILAATVLAGYPYADVPYPGVTMVILANDDQQLAQDKANELSELCWDLRFDFLARVVPLDRALNLALQEPHGPVVLADQADNPGGGPPEDGTIALKDILNRNITNVCVAFIRDPEAVETAINAGLGNNVTMKVGGKTDPLVGDPLELTGTVKHISDGKYIPEGQIKVLSDMGPTVVFHVQGIDIIITSKMHQAMDLQAYRCLNLEPTEYKILLVKSCVMYRTAHEPIASRIIELDLPGWHGTRLAAFPWTKLKRPVYPVDAEAIGISELQTE